MCGIEVERMCGIDRRSPLGSGQGPSMQSLVSSNWVMSVRHGAPPSCASCEMEAVRDCVPQSHVVLQGVYSLYATWQCCGDEHVDGVAVHFSVVTSSSG